MNAITKLTRHDIFDVLINGIETNNFLTTDRTPFYIWGNLSPFEFLKRLYPLDKMESNDIKYPTAANEIYIHTVVKPNNIPNDWIFKDKRFKLNEGSDEYLLNFLCEIFHPEVRDEKSIWEKVFERLNILINHDGYEFYIKEIISGRAVYSWRLIKDAFTRITQEEISMFINMFNRGGYVLDFSTHGFDTFTKNIIGLPLCEHYGLSKGKSLIKFTEEWNEKDIIKLIIALFDYYINNKSFEKESSSSKYSDNIEQCSKIITRLKNNMNIVEDIVEDLKCRFSSEYMDKQLNLMQSMQKENPTEAIGKAKELIESCCKTILEDKNIEINRKWNIVQLVNETVELLRITPENIPDKIPDAKSMKAILGNLKAIAINVAALRNHYGSGHGKPASFKGLEERHAKLAVGSAAVLVDFLWCTHERRK